MELLLTAEEHELLISILEHRHRDLMKEIWHTDHREFKELLRRQERLIESMISRLRNAPVPELREVCRG
ncbi:MAG TPA: hypothetical protein VGL89_20285 [Candidatus Koribacter sp.]